MRAKASLRDFGPIDAPLYLLARFLRRLPGNNSRLLKYTFWSQPIPEARLMPRRASAVAICALESGDPLLAQIPRDPKLVQARLANGDICLGAARNDRLLASMWLATGVYEEDEVRASFDPRPRGRAAWDYDIFILPEERGGLLFARLWEAAYELLRQRGYRWSVSRISSFNLVSSASQARMGAKPVGWGLFLILFNCQLMISSIEPRLHFCLPGRRGPALPIDASAGARGGDP